VQLGLLHVPAVQAPLAQSLPAAQRLPGGHGLHVPPQSTSVSVPFFTESAHPGVWQTPAVHTELRQSLGNRHAAPPVHTPHAPPPQSMSVSLPFLTKSVQLAAWQTAAQTSDTQSPAALQTLPVPHDGQVAPPQSASVSLPLTTASLHVSG
jgi:hypothetical protein